jgi:hypothetical protein
MDEEKRFFNIINAITLFLCHTARHSKLMVDNASFKGNAIIQGVRKLKGDNLKVVWAEFSTLS